MTLTIEGPMHVATLTGSFFHNDTARLNLGLVGLAFGSAAPGRRWYSQHNGRGFAPHCSLNRYVPSSGVERPKSNSRQPAFAASSIMSQYKRWFGQSELKSRTEEAHGTSVPSPVRYVMAAATGFVPRRTT